MGIFSYRKWDGLGLDNIQIMLDDENGCRIHDIVSAIDVMSPRDCGDLAK
jgi:hypothetical protein